MPRSTGKIKRPPPAKVPAHPLLLEADLAGWAGERIARGGRKDALLGRVEALQMSLNGRSIEARVRGKRPLPYRVEVWVDEPAPGCSCTCSREVPGPCRHAVAALETLRFPLPSQGGRPGEPRRRPGGRQSWGKGRIVQHAPAAPGFVILGNAERTQTRQERIAAARAEELALCRQRARRQRPKVTPLPTTGGAPRFEIRERTTGEIHVATLRGTKLPFGSCTCGAFAASELATCKHLERARSWLQRQRKDRRPAIPTKMLSLWWRPRPWPEQVPVPLSEIRVDVPGDDLPDPLGRYFGSEGWLKPPPDGEPPTAWAGEAREEAARVALARGWVWDLDPAVNARIREACADETLDAQRAAPERFESLWEEIRSGLELRLHAYQETGSRFLARRGRAFLADDMGLGKTVQAVAAALVLRRTTGAHRALVVCPASLKHQWSHEIDKICRERATVIEGPPAARLAAYDRWRQGFLILNYELVLRDLDALRAARPDLVILDEAQRIKNWSTKTARAVKQLRSPHAFILTGTPLENRLLELHSLVEFLYPRATGPRWRLLPFHTVTEARGRVIAYEGLDVLRGRLSGFFLRRERRDVLDQLPERTDNTFWTGMTLAQRKPYRKLASTVAQLVSRKHALGPGEVRAMLAALTGMRILCNALAQFAWNEYEPLLRGDDPPGKAELRAVHSPKLEEFARVLEDLLDESQEKIVVFSQWERMLRLTHWAVRGLLTERDLRAEVFHGGLSSQARGDMLEAFRLDPEFRVMFSTDAGGLGLNLQEAASIVVNLEVPWNPAVLEQRIGRVHRLGQRRSVQVLHFVTAGAVEERVRQVVETKRALFRGLFVDGANEISLVGPGTATFLEQVRTLIDDADSTG